MGGRPLTAGFRIDRSHAGKEEVFVYANARRMRQIGVAREVELRIAGLESRREKVGRSKARLSGKRDPA
jgi:hypothetical protein